MGAGGALAGVQGGLGLLNAIKGPPSPQLNFQQPASVSGPGGTQGFNALTGQSSFVPTQDPTQVQSNQLAQLYRNQLLGGDFGQFQQGIQSQIGDIQGRLGGEGFERPSFDQWLQNRFGVAKGDLSHGDARRAFEEYANVANATPGGITGDERTQLENQLSGLQGALGIQDPGAGLGAIGQQTAERQVQIGEQTGALEDLLGQRAEQSFQGQLGSLARRGVTGGTAEFDLGQRQAETLSNIGQQSAAFGEQLRQGDEQFKLQLLSQIEAGLSGQAAQGLAQQQLSGAQGFAQQQLAAQQAQNQQLFAQQQAADFQNSLGLAGQAAGFLLPPGQQQGDQQFDLTRFNQDYGIA